MSPTISKNWEIPVFYIKRQLFAILQSMNWFNITVLTHYID